jgi:hypothetical protein
MSGYDNYFMVICREIKIEAVKYFCRRLKAVQCVDPAMMLPLNVFVIPACIWQESSLAHCGLSGFPLKNVAGMMDKKVPLQHRIVPKISFNLF